MNHKLGSKLGFSAITILLVGALLAILGCHSAPKIEKANAPMRVVLTFDDGVADHLKIAAPELEKRGWRGVFNIVTDWIGRPGKLTWEDVRELIKRGHEVTTHTKSHPNLVKLLQEGRVDDVRNELKRSRDEIADKAGFCPRYMCAPYVAQNGETAKLCRECGLNEMSISRTNFGEGNEDKVGEFLKSKIVAGCKRVDLLHHGIAKAGGGWCPFADRDSFVRHLDAIKAAEERGEIIVTDYDGANSDCLLKAEAWPHHGIVALSFDDRNFADWERTLPMFEKYGASATFFICGNIGSNELRFVKRAFSRGFEVGLHGAGHRNADTHIPKLGEREFWRLEIEPQLKALETIGVRPFSYAYPNTRRNDETDAVFLRHGFTRLRGRGNGMISPNPYDPKGEKLDKWRKVAECDDVFDPACDFHKTHNIKGVILGSAYHTDIGDIMNAISRAGNRAETLAILSHGISDSPNGISAKTEWIERILKEANSLGVVVTGVR